MSRPTRTDDASAGLTAANSGMNRRRFLAGTAALAAGGMLMGRPLPAAAQEAPAKGAAARAASSYKLDLGGYAGPELTSQPITLKFMRQEFPPHVNAVLEEAYKEFSAAYPNITIQEEKVPYGDLQKKMQIYVSSGAAPDVMMGRTDFIEAYHAGNIALPLQDYFLDEFLHDILDNQFKAASAKGNFYGAPWETYFTMMYFNRDIFKKAGVPTPPEVTDVNAGWTAEEFIAALDELTQKLRAQGDSTTWALSAATHGNDGPGANYAQVESLWVRSQGDPNADKGSSAYKTFLGVSEDGLQATGYLDSIEDMPLMEGLKETGEGGIAFDKPDGRIVRAVAEGRVADADVRRFYTQTLPQLGWTHARNIELINGLLVFRRENERLEIQIVPQKGELTEVRFSIEPE